LHGKQFLSWQKSIGQIEALQSLAVIFFNPPDWCLPAMSKNFHIKLENAGHPLIPDSTRVNNSYEASQTGVVDVLTGSNMSGKSTFLRTLGVNIILALAGAPVCADKMLISSLKLMTCMRVQDDLYDRTSTFYAEIKRLKRIMIENEKESQSFFLLDEPLRGTNSNDKRAGSLAIMKNIIMQ
jgi:DNA mismatch repair ATPase MutS